MTEAGTREYCIVMPLTRLPSGEPIERVRWPLHVTVVGNFRMEPAEVDVLAGIVRGIATSIDVPHAVVGGDALFGPDGDIPVQLAESDDLHRLHVSLLDAIEAAADIRLLIPAHSRDGFRPHVTETADGRLPRGTALELRHLVLVEIGPDGDPSVAVPLTSTELRG